jgi:hypothetical protein
MNSMLLQRRNYQVIHRNAFDSGKHISNLVGDLSAISVINIEDMDLGSSYNYPERGP